MVLAAIARKPGKRKVLQVALLLAATLFRTPVSGAQSVDARVDSLLRLMSLEEKIGEMTQVDLSVVATVKGTATRPLQLDSAKLHEIIVRRHVGSLLNVASVALTPKQWIDVTATIQRFAARRRVRVPVLYAIDAVHGFDYMVGGTIFPHNIAMAATWNPMLVRREHQITGYETRSAGVAWNFAPVLDVGRQPLWSRFFETFGEDPYLASVLGVAAVQGEQDDPVAAVDSMLRGSRPRMLGPPVPAHPTPSDGGSPFIATTGKSFIGYGNPMSGRDRTSASLSERQLRDLFLPPFRAAINAGMRTIMVNTGEINGIPVHSSHEILTDLLRGELGFKGVVVSDWEDIARLQTVTHVARTRRDAVRMAINAGIDINMVPYDTDFIDDLVSLVHSGEVIEARINESARRILRLKIELGLFESPGAMSARLAKAGAPALQEVSRQAAEEAVTLVKNERGLLPLSQGTRILVAGPGATSLPAQHGPWTYTWQGTDTDMYPRGIPALLDGLRTQFGTNRVAYSPGATLTEEANIADAVNAARDADVVVLALAEPPVVEKPGDIEDLALPEAQLKLARAIEATGKPVIITLFESRPRTIRTIVDGARAIVLGYYTGPHGGDAVARVLSGAVNPSGRLPFTYPRNAASVVHYDRSVSDEVGISSPTGGYNPEWAFGFGLSYTTFSYSELALARDTIGQDDTLSVTVNVANVGSRTGMEVVQLYTHQMTASITPPMRKLRAFEKIELTPGERRVVRFRVPASELGFTGRNDRYAVEPGGFELYVGGHMASFTIR
ncbi:MAG: glycoside hydrolase family 3 N-terminal domain-containing protein [bacterium]